MQKKFSFGLLILMFILCFSTMVMADRTYLTPIGFPSYEPVFSGDVDVEVGVEYSEGTISGAVIGEYNNDSIWLEVTSGDYAGYGFGFGTSTGVIGRPPYIDMQSYTSNWIDANKPGQPSYVAVYGDVGAIGCEDTFELTSLFGTQYSGTFYTYTTYEGGIDTSGTVSLDTYLFTITTSLSGYYSGTMTVTGLAFVFDVSGLDPFSNLGVEELVGFVGTYDWSETGVGNDGEIYAVFPWGIGAVTGALKGVLVGDFENLTAFIEHAGTAPPVPLPSTMLLLGSGLLGLIGIRKRVVDK